MNKEARAFMYDALARAPLFISILFLSTVFLQYANLEAGCTKDGWEIEAGQTEEDAIEAEVECNGKAFGFKPSSILTTLNTGAGLLLAVILPVAGAIVDHTPHRKSVTLYALYLFWFSNVRQQR
jgi:MFS-type transporter involved in bile tolerance (Atg22 family)